MRFLAGLAHQFGENDLLKKDGFSYSAHSRLALEMLLEDLRDSLGDLYLIYVSAAH